MSANRCLLLFLAPLLLFVFAACGETEEVAPSPGATTASPTPGDGATPTPTPVASHNPLPTPPADWKTYRDTKFDLSLRYPPDWYLLLPTKGSGSFSLYSYDPETAPGISRPIPNDQIKILAYVAEGVYEPLEQWLTEWNGPPPTPTILSTSEVDLGGKTGLRQVSEHEGQQSISYSVKLSDGRVFVISAVPADSKLLADFESILASLNFSVTP